MSKLSEKLTAAGFPVPSPNSKIAHALRRVPVGESPEFNRILGLPRRKLKVENKDVYLEWPGKKEKIPDLTPVFKKPGGRMTLRPLQNASLWEAYQNNGAFLMLSVGEGKCVDKSVELFDYSTGRRRLVEELGELEVASLQDKGFLVKKAGAFYSGKKECMQINVADGTQLIVSFDHPILTQRGWIEAKELLVTDFVAIATQIPEPFRYTQALDEEVVLLAYMLADGGCSQVMASFTNMTPKIIEEFQRISTSICGGWSERKQVSKARQFHLLKSIKFRKKWNLFGLSKEKRLHPSLWGLPKEQVVLFLNRFWACDGHISERSVEITLASEKLIDDLRFLLLRLNIRSRKNYTPKKLTGRIFPAWRIMLSGKSALDFLNKIGPVLGKEQAWRKLKNSLEQIKRNTNYDVVPIHYALYAGIFDELKLKFNGERSLARKFLHLTKGQYISREKFIAFCKKWNYEGIYSFFNSEQVAWERVKKCVLAGVRDVYDLNVPDTHNFIANGVVIHNTLVSLLLPEAMNAKRAVLLVKPELRDQLIKRDIPLYNKYFYLPLNKIFVVAYSELSSARQAEILEKIQPDLIIADEAHKLRLKSSARTRRFLRYMRKHPEVRFVALSGTFTRRSIMDAAHLIELALKKNSPVPKNYKDLEEWCEAIDIADDPRPPGVLGQFCVEGENVREGYQRRLVETPGVVYSDEMSLGTSLLIIEKKLEIPDKIKKELARLYDTWEIEDEELSDAMSLNRVARQEVCGFYYRWVWPNNVKDIQWVNARRQWHREVRTRLLHTSLPGLDSPFLLYNAAAAGKWQSLAFPAWQVVKHRPEPPTIPVWLDYFMAKDAILWGKQQEKNKEGGIIWCEHTALGEMICKGGDWVYYGQGMDAGTVDKSKQPVIVCSIKAQGEGRNLQAWNKALVTSPPASGNSWEQLLGRLHRQGNTADEIEFYVYLHCKEFVNAFEQAQKDAAFIEESQGQKQKLNFAQIIRLENGSNSNSNINNGS